MPRETETQHHSSFDSEVILVVDDEPSQLITMQLMLDKHDFNVVAVDSGAKAIEAYEQYKPSIILLDAMMPELNGFEVCEQISSRSDSKNTSIIMLTSLDDDKSIHKAFNSGAIDYITKPVYWPVLLARLSYLLRAKIAEKKILQSHRMQTASNTANVLTHNFNNILASILGYSELLKDSLSSSQTTAQEKYVDEIQNASNKALALISQMQVLTEIKITDPVELNPLTLLNKSVNILESTKPETVALITIARDINGNIKADPSQFQQMLIYLLNNSCQAMDDAGSITIELKNTTIADAHCNSCAEEFSGNYIELSFKDDGTGINDAIIEKIFDPYFSTQPIYMATGMSLAIVHGIVHESGGHIIVSNNSDKGVTFRIFFPVIE